MVLLNAKKDAIANKIAEKAIPLDVHLSNIRDAKTLEEKKIHAIAMANDFQAGGKDAFILAVGRATKMTDIDRLAYNAALKGEGMSTKRF